MTGVLLLTGNDLTVDDVWDVAIDRREAALADSAIERMTQSRSLLDDLRGEHTYGVNTGFGRFVSESIPEEQSEELQLRLLRSHACGVGEPYPDDVVRAAMLLRANAIAKGYSGRARRDGRAPARRAHARDRAARPGAGLGRRERRPRAARAPRAPLVGEGEAFVDGRRVPGRRRSRGRGCAGRAAGEGGPLAHQRHAVHVRDGALALVRARRLERAADIACSLSLEALQGLAARASTSAIHAARPHPRARSRRRRTCACCSRGRRSSSRTAGATRCRTRTRCAARHRCTARAATCSTTSRAPSRSSSTPRPTTRSSSLDERRDRLGRQLPRPAGRVRARQPRASRSRSSRTSPSGGSSSWSTRPSPTGLPPFLAPRGRDQLGHDDRAVRRGRARLGEQGRSRIRRASTRSRRAPGRRITSRWGTPRD